MNAFDADAHVEESPTTFSDAYLFPRRTGRGAHHFSTPASVGETPSSFTATKRDELGSVTLADVDARLRQMDADGIDRQVIYPTLFLAYPLTDDEGYAGALCRSYNRWIKATCDRRPDR